MPPAAGASSWLAVETKAGYRRGDVVPLSPLAVVQGTRALQQHGASPDGLMLALVQAGKEIEFAGAEAIGDARLMKTTTIGAQRVKVIFRVAVESVQEVAFTDFPVPGPRTMMWCLKFINRRNGGAIDWHRFWEHTHGLKSEFWGVAEHFLIMQAIELWAISFSFYSVF